MLIKLFSQTNLALDCTFVHTFYGLWNSCKNSFNKFEDLILAILVDISKSEKLASTMLLLARKMSISVKLYYIMTSHISTLVFRKLKKKRIIFQFKVRLWGYSPPLLQRRHSLWSLVVLLKLNDSTYYLRTKNLEGNFRDHSHIT